VASGVMFRDTRIRRNLLALLVLLLALLALLFAYYVMTRPAQLVGDEGPPDTEEFRYLFSIYGFEGDLLSRPTGVAFGPDGNIYVADTLKHRILVFDSRGAFVARISGTDLGEFSFEHPVSVAVAPDGRIYALSKGDRKLVIFDRDFQPVHQVEFPDIIPTFVTVRGETLYVVTDGTIMKGTLDGTYVTQVGTRGREEGQLDLPGAVVPSADGAILYVADTLNYRVQALDAETGEALWAYGAPIPPDEAIKYRGEGRLFGLPASITLDEMGNIYVVDGTNSEIVVLSEEGSLLKTLGEVGHADGRFYFPDGIAYGVGGYIAVADKFNDRVQVFQVPAPQVAPMAARWLPLALLPLAAIALWLLLRRRTKYVAAPDFITEVIDREYVDEIARHVKKLHVTPAVFEVFGGRFEKPALVSVEPDPERMEEFAGRFLIEGPELEALTLAYQIRGKTVLLSESEPVRETAQELELVAVRLDELIERADLAESTPAEKSEVEK